MGIIKKGIKKGIIRAQVNELGLYSKAEDVAKNMRQKKGRGGDVKRFFVKQGVKAEELDALGLNELFLQERVTQQEILDRIDQNRVVMEENVNTGVVSDFEFDSYIEEIEIEDAYGRDYIDEQVNELLEDAPEFFLNNETIEVYARGYADNKTEFDDLVEQLTAVASRDDVYTNLPDDLIADLRDAAESDVRLSYDENPIVRVSLTLRDTSGDSDERAVGDFYDADFSYSLVGNEDTGFYFDAQEYDRIPERIRRSLEDSGQELITSPEEARVRLTSIAFDEEILSSDELINQTRWGDYTLEGGDNYQESRLSLPEERIRGTTKFFEGIHFPDDINNVFHVRSKDRVGPSGERILYVEELQSDWAQQGRKKGFKTEKRIKEAEEAAGKLLDEAVPLLLQIDKSNIFEFGAFPTASFLGSVGSLSDALAISRQANRSLDAAGEIVTALRIANNQALKQAYLIIRENYLETLSPQEKIDIYVGQSMGDFEATRTSDQLLQRLGPEEARRMLEAEAQNLATTNEAQLNEQVLSYAANQGLVPSKTQMAIAVAADGMSFNPSGAKSIRQQISENESWSKILEQTIEEQESFLQSYGIDPKLYSKLQNIVDKVDPEAAKLRAEKGQRNLPGEAPFVLDTDSWNKLAIKYIFKKAAEEGYDGVSFAPADVHVDRWGDEGLRVQYDQNIPRAIDKVIGVPNISPSNRPEIMEVEGYESRIYHLDDLTRDGESILEKMKRPTTMFGFAPLPLVLPQGIAGLEGLSPAQAEEQKRKVEKLEKSFPDEPSEPSSGILGALRGAGEVGYEAISDLFVEPFMGMAGAEAAFEMGATPEQVEAARKRAASLVDFETSSPTGKRYKESLKGGLGALSEYLMEESKPLPRNRYTRGSRATQSLDPLQSLFQKGIIPASEAVTDAALGIISLDPRDTEKMEEIRKEAYRPVIEAIQPI